MGENSKQPGIDQARWFARIVAALGRLWEIAARLRAGRLRVRDQHTTAAPRFAFETGEDPNVTPSVESDSAVQDQARRPDADQSCKPDRADIRPSNEIIEEPPPAFPSVSPEVQEISGEDS